MLITVIRSNVGHTLEVLGKSIRPWCFVEHKGALTEEQKAELRPLVAAKTVHVAQVRDGMPLPEANIAPVTVVAKDAT